MHMQKFSEECMHILFIRVHMCVLHMTLCMHDLFSRLCKLVVLHLIVVRDPSRPIKSLKKDKKYKDVGVLIVLIIWACVETKIILFFVYFWLDILYILCLL